MIRWSSKLLHVLVAALTLAVLDRDNDERLARLERKIDFIGEQIILAVAIVVGCVVGYIVQEEIGKGWPVLIGAGLTMGGVFLVLHSRFRRHTS